MIPLEIEPSGVSTVSQADGIRHYWECVVFVSFPTFF